MPNDYILIVDDDTSYTLKVDGNESAEMTVAESVIMGGGGGSYQDKSVSFTPTESAQSQTVTADVGYDALNEVDISVSAIPSNYVGSGVTQRTSSDLSASGNTVTAPAGYYASNASKSVQSGTEGTPTASKGTVSNHSVSVTPSVTNTEGYISGGTHTGTAVNVSASELDSGSKSITANGSNQDVVGYASVNVNVPNTYAAGDEGKVVSSGALVAQTAHSDVTPTTSDQTIDTTLNNSLKVKGDADLVAGNIKKNVEIFGVIGTYEGGGGGGTPATAVTTETLPNGADHVIISGVDISDTTAVAADVASGKYFYTAAGVKTAGTATIGGFTPEQLAANGGITGDLTFTSAITDPRSYAFRSTSISKILSDYDFKYSASMFYGCTSLTEFRTPYATSTNTVADVFRGCSSLELIDWGDRNLTTGADAFRDCNALKTIILRKTSVASLSNSNAFRSCTPIQSGGTGVDIYIPKTLYDALGTGTNDYKAASNWSTLDGYGTITWHPIEGSIYEL